MIMNTNTELLLDIAHFKFRNSLQSYEYIIKEIYDGTLYNELKKPYLEIQTDTAGTPISSSGIITEGRLSSLYRNADLDFFFKDDGWVVDFMQNIDLFHTEIEKKIAAYLNKKFNYPNHDKIMDEIKNREKYKSLIADLGVIFKMFGFKKEKDIQEFYDKVISLTNTSKLSNTTADADLLTKTSLPEIDSFNITNHKAKNTDEENLKIRAFDTIFMYFSYIAVLLDNICFEYLQENVKVIVLNSGIENTALAKAKTEHAAEIATITLQVAAYKAAKAAAEKALAEAENAKIATALQVQQQATALALQQQAALADKAELTRLQTELAKVESQLAAVPPSQPLPPQPQPPSHADAAAEAARLKAAAEAEAARLKAAAEAEAEAARLAAEYTYNKFLTEHIGKTNTPAEKDNLDKIRKTIELLVSVDSIVGTHKDYTTVNSDGYKILAYMEDKNKENLIEIKNAIDNKAQNNNLNDIITNFNNKIEKNEYKNNVNAIYKYKDVADQLKTDIETFKLNIADLDAKIKAIQEDLFKIPYMIVKMIDDKDIITGGADGDKYLIKDPNSNCVIIGETCQLESVDAGTKFGPYNHVLAPTNDSQNKLTNPTNKQIFDNLTTGGYNIIQKIKAEKCIKLFGYGFSGSGKTYTLLDTGEKSNEQSLFILLLDHLKTNNIQNYDNLKIQIAVYYPHFQNKIGNYTQGTRDQIISDKMTANMDEFKNELDKANVELAKLTDPQNILEKIRDFNKNVMKKYAYILPTKNNHESSRAFTIVNIQNSGKNLIQFIDLPGIEKKVDMIKDYFFPNFREDLIRGYINNRKQNISIEKNVYAFKISKSGSIDYNIKQGRLQTTTIGRFIAENIFIIANKEYTTYMSTIHGGNTVIYEQIFWLKKIVENGNVDEYNTKIDTLYTTIYQKIFDINSFDGKFKRTSILQGTDDITGLTNDIYSFFYLKEGKKTVFVDKIIKNLFNYLNYTGETKFHYLYKIKYKDIEECVTKFEEEFLIDRDNKFSNNLKKHEIFEYNLHNNDQKVLDHKYIFEKIFLFDIFDTTTKDKIDSNPDGIFYFGANIIESKNTDINININTRKIKLEERYKEHYKCKLIKKYNSPVLTAIAMIFNYIETIKPYSETQNNPYTRLGLLNNTPNSESKITIPEKLILNKRKEEAKEKKKAKETKEKKDINIPEIKQKKDKLFHKAIFLTLLVNFITDQGQEIVTSLEHLLFEFLIQNPMGIKKYNEGIEALHQTPKSETIDTKVKHINKYIDRKFENPFADPTTLTGATHHDKIVTLCKDINTYMKDFAKGSKYKIVSQYSGMEETITRKYLPGVHDVLKIDKDSRFINVLTILRRKGKLDTKTNKFEMEDATKRCQGAINTLVFGELLSGDFGCNSVRKYPILEKPPRDTRTQLNQEADPKSVQRNWLKNAEQAVAQADRWAEPVSENAPKAEVARAEAQERAARVRALRGKPGGKFKSRKPSKSKSKSKSNNRSKIRKKDLILLNRKNKIKRIATLKKYNMK